MYGLPEPPFFLLFIGLFAGVTCGSAFEAILKQSAQAWSQKPSESSLDEVRNFRLLLPFLGICFGILLFLAAGLQIFGIPSEFAFGVSLMMTLFVGGLVWGQLGEVLSQLQQGGSQALDLDAFR
ncbi:MAG: hypothetical protein SAJ12_16145 [Jaaginema sp. PMC 1079.18]|nr:hypothetical protein [Jaaginema sp. PMC 1080.18]MEC4852516.1 hypothetical protein [Jaaginema sp. PMC 1079.18]MEC4865846.1 hypothetical protein [Jaaginema sp. PMC 1078.18]